MFSFKILVEGMRERGWMLTDHHSSSEEYNRKTCEHHKLGRQAARRITINLYE